MPKEFITQRQRQLATELIAELGYDLDNYDFDKMSKSEASDLISELLDEKAG